MLNEILRRLPQVDALLRHPAFSVLLENYGQAAVREQLRQLMDEERKALIGGKIPAADAYDPENLAEVMVLRLQRDERHVLQRVINCTGILLHTNLGRAPLGERVAQRVHDIVQSYCNLEYDLERGRRGSRYTGLEGILCKLFDVEAALVVNNNAAAMLLILDTLAKGHQVLVSRGELVEIGGSFRVPDIMTESGAALYEVGTTNKTRLADYEKALDREEDITMVLKVHKSNFKIEGFTEEASLEELAGLCRKRELPLIYDLGSGLLQKEGLPFFREEPSLEEALAAEPDLVCFSGDKLLGGPQAGIILGRRELIERLKKNPLTRALRVDKMVIATLTEVLKIYRDETLLNQEIPLRRMLHMPKEQLEERADGLADRLLAAGLNTELVQTEGEIGGGSTPGVRLPSVALALRPEDLSISLNEIEEHLRLGQPPVIAYVKQDQLLFDLRTVAESELPLLAEAIIRACGKA